MRSISYPDGSSLLSRVFHPDLLRMLRGRSEWTGRGTVCEAEGLPPSDAMRALNSSPRNEGIFKELTHTFIRAIFKRAQECRD